MCVCVCVCVCKVPSALNVVIEDTIQMAITLKQRHRFRRLKIFKLLYQGGDRGDRNLQTQNLKIFKTSTGGGDLDWDGYDCQNLKQHFGPNHGSSRWVGPRDYIRHRETRNSYNPELLCSCVRCVTWLIHTCDVTHPHVRHDSSIWSSLDIRTDTCKNVIMTYLICMCAMTHPYVLHYACMDVRMFVFVRMCVLSHTMYVCIVTHTDIVTHTHSHTQRRRVTTPEQWRQASGENTPE